MARTACFFKGIALMYRTVDIDLTLAPGEQNHRRAFTAARELFAQERHIFPEEQEYVSHWRELEFPAMVLMDSKLGRFDLLHVVTGKDYDFVAANSVQVPVRSKGKEVVLRCLNIPTYLSMKVQAGRQKDRELLTWMRDTRGIVPPAD